MKRYGLIGYPLKHSFSKKYFTNKFEAEGIDNCQYELFPIDKIESINDLILKTPNLLGLNVTIPYKETIIPYLDELSEEAEEIGAVNTILLKNGKRIGYNTDVMGFRDSLFTWLPSPEGALILGTGGASKAIAYVLKTANIPYLKVSRSPDKGDLIYSEIDEKRLRKYPLLINTTPLGTFPKVDSAPNIPYNLLSSTNSLYDLVYNPEKTVFLKRGATMSSATKNGLEMLVAQAEYSWEIWTNIKV